MTPLLAGSVDALQLEPLTCSHDRSRGLRAATRFENWQQGTRKYVGFSLKRKERRRATVMVGAVCFASVD